MNDRYRLVALGNDQLLASLNVLVRREHCALADMLAHLAELDERRLFLDLGYSSLFAYCTEALQFCKSTAGRRIAAARVCRKYPSAFLRVATGELRLSVLSVLGSYLNEGNAAELFDACSGKSFDRVEELLAERFPRADVQDAIRRLPDVARRTPYIEANAVPSAPIPNADHTAIREQNSSATLANPFSTQAKPSLQKEAAVAAALLSFSERMQPQLPPSLAARERVEPLSPGRFGVRFTADAEFRDLLEEVRALSSHEQPRGELLPLMKRAFETYRRELEKKRFAVGAKPRSAVTRGAQSKPRLKRTRRVSAAVRRAVYERDQGSCAFSAVDGRRCGARRFLQLDHVEPRALHGESTVDNLRLYCRAHNQHSARAYFGSNYVRGTVKRAKSERRKHRHVTREAEGVEPDCCRDRSEPERSRCLVRNALISTTMHAFEEAGAYSLRRPAPGYDAPLRVAAARNAGTLGDGTQSLNQV